MHGSDFKYQKDKRQDLPHRYFALDINMLLHSETHMLQNLIFRFWFDKQQHI